MKIVAATTVTSPYITARYEHFVKQNPQHDLVLLEFGRVSSEYAWAPTQAEVPYQRVVLSEYSISSINVRKRISMIHETLDELAPDVLIVCGYGVTGMAAILSWAQKVCNHVAVVMLSDSTEEDLSRSLWKEKIKQRVIGLCGSALVAGIRHRNYMRKLGMLDQQIFTGYDVVDNNYFWGGARKVNETAASQRKMLGLPEQYFLTSARFLRSESGIDRVKNLHRLIEAYANYLQQSNGQGFGLVILGDGDLRTELEMQIADLKLTDHVVLPGFRQYRELPAYYGLASVFVLASVKDTWGLVVNEAMASGLPVLVSERCGCSPDLVANGRNGYTFDPYNVEALTRLMLLMSSDDCDRTAMGRASKEIISHWTPETFSKGLMQAVDAARSIPLPRAGWMDKALLWVLSYR